MIALAGAARANPADVFGFGSRAAAMGGAATALTDDAAANYYNPAGLVRQKDLRIDLGYMGAVPSLKLNGRDSGVDATHGFAVGVSAPGALGPVRIAFGAALFLPDDRLTRVRALSFVQPRWVYYDNRTQRILLAANLAVQIVPGLYLGGGLSFMSRTQGTVALKGRLALFDETGADSALVTAIDVDLVAVRYPQFGISWDVTRWLTVAASYRHSFLLKLDQGFAIRGDIGNAGMAPVVKSGYFEAHSASSDLFQPWQLTFALAARLTRRLTIAFDATYSRWSEFETPAAQIQIMLDIGPQFNPLVHIPPSRSYPPPGFHDILSPRLGVEWRALSRGKLGLDLRAGYSYEPSPAPEQSYESNYADADKHRFSVGAGLELGMLGPVLPRPLAIDAHLGLTWLPTRYNRKIDPLDPTGDFTAGGNVLEMGMTTRWRF
jgi:long-chain fatty acid transport protein